MQDEPLYSVGSLDGAAVGVQHTRIGQDILIRHSNLGQRLACLLAFGQADIVWLGDAPHWRIVHDRQVDSLLVELIDILISIRYSHPRLVQLELELEPAEP